MNCCNTGNSGNWWWIILVILFVLFWCGGSCGNGSTCGNDCC